MHPGDEVPVCVFAFLCEGCGKLCLSAAAHAYQHGASSCWIGNQRVQLLLLSTLDETVSRYHVRPTTENDAARLAVTGCGLCNRVCDIVNCIENFRSRFATLFVVLQ